MTLQWTAVGRGHGCVRARGGSGPGYHVLHTLKGNAGLFGLTTLARDCHALEDQVRDGVQKSMSEEQRAELLEVWRSTRALVEPLLGGFQADRVSVSRCAGGNPTYPPSHPCAQGRSEPWAEPTRREHSRARQPRPRPTPLGVHALPLVLRGGIEQSEGPSVVVGLAVLPPWRTRSEDDAGAASRPALISEPTRRQAIARRPDGLLQNCAMNFQASGGTKAFRPSSPVEVPSFTADGVCAPSNVHTLTG